MDNITTSRSISVEELREESNLIIYISGLILLIVWKVTMICQVRLHRKNNHLEKLVMSRRYQIPWQSSKTMNVMVYHTRRTLPPKGDIYIYKVLCLSSLSLASIVGQYG